MSVKESVYVIQNFVDLHKFNFDFLILYKMYFQNYIANRSIKVESFTNLVVHNKLFLTPLQNNPYTNATNLKKFRAD